MLQAHEWHIVSVEDYETYSETEQAINTSFFRNSHITSVILLGILCVQVWCIHVAHVEQAPSVKPMVCPAALWSSEEIFQVCLSALFSVFYKTHGLYLFIFILLASLLD